MDKDDIADALARIERKCDAIQQSQTTFQISCARELATLGASANAAHHRLDETQARESTNRGRRATLWIGIGIAVLSAALALGTAFLTRSEAKATQEQHRNGGKP